MWSQSVCTLSSSAKISLHNHVSATWSCQATFSTFRLFILKNQNPAPKNISVEAVSSLWFPLLFKLPSDSRAIQRSTFGTDSWSPISVCTEAPLTPAGLGWVRVRWPLTAWAGTGLSNSFSLGETVLHSTETVPTCQVLQWLSVRNLSILVRATALCNETLADKANVVYKGIWVWGTLAFKACI